MATQQAIAKDCSVNTFMSLVYKLLILKSNEFHSAKLPKQCSTHVPILKAVKTLKIFRYQKQVPNAFHSKLSQTMSWRSPKGNVVLFRPKIHTTVADETCFVNFFKFLTLNGFVRYWRDRHFKSNVMHQKAESSSLNTRPWAFFILLYIFNEMQYLKFFDEQVASECI